MGTDKQRWEIYQITEAVIGAACKVGNTLGSGFLEKFYQNALANEIRRCRLLAMLQHLIQVKYEGAAVGDFFADLPVQDEVLVELKAVKALDEIHLAQCLNYLKATGLKVGLLANFGNPKIEIRRVML